jgi:hypothetical protein
MTLPERPSLEGYVFGSGITGVSGSVGTGMAGSGAGRVSGVAGGHSGGTVPGSNSFFFFGIT